MQPASCHLQLYLLDVAKRKPLRKASCERGGFVDEEIDKLTFEERFLKLKSELKNLKNISNEMDDNIFTTLNKIFKE